MKRELLFLIFIGFIAGMSAQDTVYIDKYHAWTDKDNAVEYGIITHEKEHRTTVHFHTLDGRLLGVEEYSAYGKHPENNKKEGLSRWVYPNGQDSIVCNYINNRPVGLSTCYYPSGQERLVRTYMKDGRRVLMQYYESGKLRRKEVRQDNKYIEGKLYAEDGTKLEFFPYITMPQFPGGMNVLLKVLSHAIKYPKDAQKLKKEGTVIIRFIIDREGKMEGLTFVKKVYPSLDEEAMRIVEGIAAVYTWIPGKEDGKPIRVKYTLPVSFHLNK